MKGFDFYGQALLIILALLLALDFNGFGILYAALVMLIIGIWQFISTIFNMSIYINLSHFSFFRNNFLIAVIYTIVFISARFIPDYKFGNVLFIIMFSIPPFLIFRYWIKIGRIYGIPFLKRKASNEHQ